MSDIGRGQILWNMVLKCPSGYTCFTSLGVNYYLHLPKSLSILDTCSSYRSLMILLVLLEVPSCWHIYWRVVYNFEKSRHQDEDVHYDSSVVGLKGIATWWTIWRGACLANRINKGCVIIEYEYYHPPPCSSVSW